MFGLISDWKGWKVSEYTWLAIALIATAVASYGGSSIEFAAALTNIICVILVAKGRVSNYIWGLIGVVLYGYVSYTNKLYGNAALNIIYYMPMQFIGMYYWLKNTNDSASDVTVAPLSLRGWVAYTVATVVGTYAASLILAHTGDPSPVLDGFTAFASIVAMWLMVKRHAEQWIVWVLVDVVTVYIWWTTTPEGQRSYAMIAMWIVFTGNALYGLWKWYITKKNK